MHFTKYIRLTLFALALIPLCWLIMLLTHESGHVITAIIFNVEVEQVELNPLTFSRTDFAHSCHDAAIVWGGGIGGAMIPLLIWVLWRFFKIPGDQFGRFIAGFCLIANGVYFGFDYSGGNLTDGGKLLAQGVSRTYLTSFGVLCLAAGLALWNGQGRRWGINAESLLISNRALIILYLCLIALFISEWILFPPGAG